jgi:anti-sigma regulatory factor (Ser/Thr protein kinase)
VFWHEALFYSSMDEYLSGTVPFLREGIMADEAALVVVPTDRHAALREALGVDAKAVRFRDMAEVGRNPNNIIPWVLRPFIAEHDPRPVRIVGEPVYSGRRAEELDPCVQHEAVINLALADGEASILCPYNVAALPEMVTAAEQTHQVIVQASGRQKNCAYRDPQEVVEEHNRPLAEPDTVDAVFVFDEPRFAQLRQLIARHAVTAGAPPRRVFDAQTAVTEIATNALTHGGPSIATFRAWSHPGRVVYEIRGAGRITDPLAGRVVPPPDAPHGRGLVVANRLCDLIQTYTVVTGTVTRMHLTFDPHGSD